MKERESRHPAVLITGASRGIGAAAARRCAQGGWDVAVNYCRSRAAAEALAAELRERGVRAEAIPGDVSRPEEAAALTAAAEQTFGGLDALVCSAGIAAPQMLLTDLSTEGWRELMGTNLDGVFHVLRAAVPGFVRRQAGSIVTISSMWGITGGSCEAAYSASKAGIIGLTRAMAKELGPSHIRVNCVAPGVIDTDMNRHLSAGAMAALAEETPRCRIGRQLHHGTGASRRRRNGHRLTGHGHIAGLKTNAADRMSGALEVWRGGWGCDAPNLTIDPTMEERPPRTG